MKIFDSDINELREIKTDFYGSFFMNFFFATPKENPKMKILILNQNRSNEQINPIYGFIPEEGTENVMEYFVDGECLVGKFCKRNDSNFFVLKENEENETFITKLEFGNNLNFVSLFLVYEYVNHVIWGDKLVVHDSKGLSFYDLEFI